MPNQSNQFVKIAPNLKDPRQNEFVQDYLSELQRVEYTGSLGDHDLLGATIELVQEIYKPAPPSMTRLKDLYAGAIILNPDAEGAIRSVQVNGFTHGGKPAWILIHSHTITSIRVSTVPPESDLADIEPNTAIDYDNDCAP